MLSVSLNKTFPSFNLSLQGLGKNENGCQTPVNQEPAVCKDPVIGPDIPVSLTDEFILAENAECATSEGCFTCTKGKWLASKCGQSMNVFTYYSQGPQKQFYVSFCHLLPDSTVRVKKIASRNLKIADSNLCRRRKTKMYV